MHKRRIKENILRSRARCARIIEETKQLIANNDSKEIRMRALTEKCGVATALEADFQARFQPLSKCTENLPAGKYLRV
jgi:hypothetical protein